MENLKEFFDMGGYAMYVWGSYGAAFLVMTYNAVVPVIEKKKLIKRLRSRS